MKTSSCKAKGRRLQQWVAGKISEITEILSGKDAQIESREMGQSGTDIKLYGKAAELFPFSIECKNQESWGVHKWIKQAESNRKIGTDWIIFAKRNRQDPVVIMDADRFMDIYEQVIRG